MQNAKPLRPRRYRGTPIPESQRRLRPEDILRGFVIGVIVIVIGTILGQFTFNQIHGRGTAYFILAAGLGIVLAIVAYQRIQIVMCLYLIFAWLSVGQTPTLTTGMTSGTGKGLELAEIGMAFLLLMWLVRIFVRGQGTFIRSRLNVLLIVYLAFCVVSAFNGDMFWDPAVAHFWGPAMHGGREPLPVTILEIGLRALSVGAFWLFANNLQDEAWLRRFSWLLAFPGAALLIGQQLRLPIHANEYTLLLIGIVACFLFAWLLEPIPANVPPRKTLRFFASIILLLVLALAALDMLHWVSIGIAVFVGIFIIALLRSKRLFFGMAVTAVALFLAEQGLLRATVYHKVQNSGDLLRFSMAHAAVLYALKFPLGVGPGNYRSYNAYYGTAAAWGTSTFTSAHNFYAQMLSELGFVGLAIAVAWILCAVFTLVWFYRHMTAGWSRTFVLGICGAWTGICAASFLGDYIIPVYHNGGVITLGTTIYAWIGLGVAFAHARRAGLLRDTPKPTEKAADLPSPAEFYPRRMEHESVSS